MSATKAEKQRRRRLAEAFPPGLPDTARLVDLVRYCRHHLHEQELISNEEYAALVSVPGSVLRLETYDALLHRRSAPEVQAHAPAVVDGQGPREADTHQTGDAPCL